MSTSPAPARTAVPPGLLWLSAIVLTALIIIQAASPGPAARADLVSAVDDYTTLTFNAGNDDVLLVLDGRAEELYAYRVKNQTSFELIEPYNIKTLFDEGRRKGAGTTK
jgi:hypothetical protein